jgi:hypothetical protein
VAAGKVDGPKIYYFESTRIAGVIAQNETVISINAALQIDLTGAVNAEHMLSHQYSANMAKLPFELLVPISRARLKPHRGAGIVQS